MAANWGSGMDMSAMPSWAQPYMAANVMYVAIYFLLPGITNVVRSGTHEHSLRQTLR